MKILLYLKEFVIRIFNRMVNARHATARREIERYLARSTDHADLEHRIKELARKGKY